MVSDVSTRDRRLNLSPSHSREHGYRVRGPHRLSGADGRRIRIFLRMIDTSNRRAIHCLVYLDANIARLSFYGYRSALRSRLPYNVCKASFAITVVRSSHVAPWTLSPTAGYLVIQTADATKDQPWTHTMTRVISIAVTFTVMGGNAPST